MAVPVISLYNAQIMAVRGEWAQEDHDYEQAAALFGQAHGGLVYDPDTYTSQGINEFTQAQLKIYPVENLRLAEDHARTAMRLDTRDAQHYFLLARVLRAQGNVQAAFDNYAQAVKLDPLNSPEYYLDTASLLLANGKLDEAVAVSSKAIDLYPQKVIDNRHHSTSLKPTLAELYVTRAIARQAQGSKDAAKADVGRALELDPENIQAKTLLR
jgi:tetratricopeptide (TPR) repeat protein